MIKDEMTSTERVTNLILGKPYDRQPIYGWLYGNLTTEIDDMFGSLDQLEDKYEFDMKHLFEGPGAFNEELMQRLRNENGGVLEPWQLLENIDDVFTSIDDMNLFQPLIDHIKYSKNVQHDRFCYVQTPGILEQFNGLFGIQNHLMYVALYPDELKEIYQRQTEWTKKFAKNCIDCGVDMVHVSDDWGAQNRLLISPASWRDMIYPYLKQIVDTVHDYGCFCSLHSDGCVREVLDGIVDLGFDLVHPYQENADMPYDIYLSKYADKFAIMGGINIQNALGIMERDELEADIRRVFGLLRGRRWVVCTTHFVQKHCKVEDMKFAYDLIYELARS